MAAEVPIFCGNIPIFLDVIGVRIFIAVCVEILFEASFSDCGVRWGEAGLAVEGFEASEGVGPFGEGCDDDVAGIADDERGDGTSAAAAAVIGDTEGWRVAFTGTEDPVHDIVLLG